VEGSAIQLNHCYGKDIDCKSAHDTIPILEMERRTCLDTPGAPAVRDFIIEVVSTGEKPGDPNEFCGDYIEQLAVAGDESVWIQGARRCNYSVSLWVQHYSVEGTLLGRNDSVERFDEPSFLRSVEIATDARGHLYLAIASFRFDRGTKDDFSDYFTLTELDTTGALTQAPATLGGLGSAQVAVTEGNGITIAGNAAQNAQRGILARLGFDREPLWMRNDLPTSGQGVGWGISELWQDADGSSTILSARDATTVEDRYGLTRVDRNGNPVWDHVVSPAFAGGYRARLSGDSFGNLLVHGTLQSNVALIQQFSPSGTAQWGWELQGGAMSVDPSTGRVVLGAQRGGLFLIPRDGSDCTLHPVSGAVQGEWLQNLAFSKSGKLFFADGYRMGRLSMPAHE
jgi:hypothetical protein